MKIIIVGGTGTIGSSVAEAFRKDHEVIVAARSSGDQRVDITDRASIEHMLKNVGKHDAIVSIAGEATWNHMTTMSEDDYLLGIRSKLMGQVNLALLGIQFLLPGGSITLTSGVLADDPVPHTTGAAMVNGAVHSFVKAAAIDLGTGPRINVVSADLVEDSAESYGSFFPGHTPVPMRDVVKAYKQSVEGTMTGQIINVRAS